MHLQVPLFVATVDPLQSDILCTFNVPFVPGNMGVRFLQNDLRYKMDCR